MLLPENYTFRPVKESDYHKYMETLSVLTTVGTVSEAQFSQLVDTWNKNPEIYVPRVIADENDEVVATGMLFIEQKLIHGCGKVGHIEDIAVAKSQQGKKLGNFLIEQLSTIARITGCYKVILDCSLHNVGFYEKCGYKDLGVFMTRRYD